MDWSLSKIIRIETGAVGISTNDLKALLSLYQIVDPSRTEELVELARAARQSSWWSRYRDSLTPKLLQFIEYEEAASVIREYESAVMPGLLQTEEYATAVMRTLGEKDLPPHIIEARVKARMTRQRLIEQSNLPLLFFILDEAVIRRLIGEKAIMRGQLTRLISTANRPNVSIEVVPFSAGIYRGFLEPFVVLEFRDPEDSDVLYLESLRDAVFSHDEAGEIGAYREVFEQLRAISLGPEGTLAYLVEIAEAIA